VIHSTFETPSHVLPVNLGNPALEPPKKRLRNIDALRGVCAILVVLAHIVPESWLGARIWTSDPLFYLDFGRIGVAAFFLISGYVIPFSIPNAGQRVTQFWIARFFRLWPAYWVCILLTLSIGSSEIPPKLTNVALNFTMFQKFFGIQDMVGVFWTLQIELVFYGLISIMVALGIAGNSNYYRIGFYVMAGSSLIMSALRGILHVRLPVALPMALTLMFLAAYIRSCRLIAKPIPGIMIVSYIVTLIPICLLGYSTNLSGADDPYRWMLAYLIGLLIFLLFESFADAPSVAVFMGTISYSVYLLHQALIKASRSLFGSKNIIADTAFVLTFTIAASWIVYRLVEIPSQRLGKTLIKRIQAAAL
jgi:peptidoglycan/LPS O-acetylase OafA/YrhL